MDNAPIHVSDVLSNCCNIADGQNIRELIENAGLKLVFLPPYSPDFNPIEEAFAEMKVWMRKNYALASCFETFEEFMEAALQYMSQKPGNHFRSCHIKM